MPSQSKSQQRLMGVAYAVKSGDMPLSDVDASYRDKVKELVDGMSLKDLKDFAETKHDDIPEEVTEGVVKIDLRKILTKISGAIGYKHDPKMREELLSAFEKDLREIMVKHDYIVEDETIEEDLSAVTPSMLGGMGDVVLPNGDAPGSGDVPAGQGKAKKKKKKLLNVQEFIKEQEQLKAFKPEQGEGEELGEGEYEVGPARDPDLEMEEIRKRRHAAVNVTTFSNFTKNR